MSPSPYPIPDALDLSQLKQKTSGVMRWVWRGYVAFGSITLFTSRWKSGKTTLLSLLLSRLNDGGTLAGSAVSKAAAVVVTEESPSVWVARGDKLDFGPNIKFICQPFVLKPKEKEWYELLKRVIVVSQRQPTLVVIDPLVSVLPGADENSAAAIVNALAPLRLMTNQGTAVLLLHHPRKGHGLDPRGSGALSSCADILMELDLPANAPPDERRRWLRARGRHDVAPSELFIKLVAAGHDYTICDPVVEDCADAMQIIRVILSNTSDKLTRGQISAAWPETRSRPSKASLYRWLQQASAQQQLCRAGRGLRLDPFRYWLPEREGTLGGDNVEAELDRPDDGDWREVINEL